VPRSIEGARTRSAHRARLKTFKKAWAVAVPKAHGVDSRWRMGSYKDLTSQCQPRFRDIDLHWHDLRHEYASRLAERGVPLAQVSDPLGHASIFTTERYDNQKLEALPAAVGRLETNRPIPAAAVPMRRPSATDGGRGSSPHWSYRVSTARHLD
jgi:integrase